MNYLIKVVIILFRGILVFTLFFGIAPSFSFAGVWDESPQTKELLDEAKGKIGNKLSYYNREKGLVVMRSSVGSSVDDEKVVWVTFQAGPSEEKGKGAEAGHFTIFYNQYLAIDGEVIEQIRKGGEIVKRKSREPGNYNTIVIDGLFQLERGEDGYQPAKLLALEDKGEYLYLSADIKPQYGKVVKYFSRQLVFLRPDMIVIYDRVVTVEKFSKSWCVNVLGCPGKDAVYIDGDVANITPGIMERKFFCRTLLPKDSIGMMIALGERGSSLGAQPGRRLERQSRDISTEDEFLNFIYVPKEEGLTLPKSELIEKKDEVGIKIVKDGKTYQLVFSQKGEATGTITVRDNSGKKIIESNFTNKIQELD